MSSRAILVAWVAVSACAEPNAPPRYLDGDVSRTTAYLPAEQQPVVLTPPPYTWAVTDAQHLVQTFTPSANGWLGYVELPVGCDTDGLLNLKVRDGIDGTILYESNHVLSGVIVDGTFQLLQVYNPADPGIGTRLAKDHVYALELAPFPAGHTCGVAPGPAGDSYAGGAGYYGTAGAWLTLPNGSGPAEDLPFITLVR